MCDFCPEPSLAICIVNWNSGRQLLDCLLSIERSARTKFDLVHVVVVDNASQDDSIALIESEHFSFAIKIVMNSENEGFAKACNKAASIAKVDYILLLNPDAVLRNDSLDSAVEFLGRDINENIGILGVQLIDGNNNIARTCARFPTVSLFVNSSLGLCRLFPRIFPSFFMSEWSHSNSAFVDHVMGAFFLVKSSLYNNLKGLDEDFFVYYEDLDFSYRAGKLGYKSYYLSDVKIFHEGGGCSKAILVKRLFYSLRSKVLYIKKHFSFFQRYFLFGVIFFLEPISRVMYSLICLKWKDAINVLKAYRMLWSWLMK